MAPSLIVHRRPPTLGLILMAGTLALSCAHYKSCLQQRQSYMTVITDGETVRVLGELYSKEWKNNRLRLYLKDCRMLRQEDGTDMILPCNRVMTYSDTDAFCIGDTLEIDGQIHMFDRAVNEGMFDSAAYYASLGIDFAIYTGRKNSGSFYGQKDAQLQQGADSSICIRRRPYFSIGEELYRLRRSLTRVVNRNLEGREAGVLCSILFGDKTNLDEEEKALYQTAGISHILAISGLHVSLLGMGLYKLLRRLGLTFAESGIAAGIMLVLYAILTGGSLSTKRAVGMILLTMLGQIFGRRTDMLNSLGLVLMILLWENPFLVTNSGLFFTLASIGGIAITGNLLSAPRGAEIRSLKQNVLDALSMSLAIQMTVLPVTAYYYYEVPLLSVFQNLIILPLLTPLLILGLAGAGIGMTDLVYPAKIFFFLPDRILRIYHGLSSMVTSISVSSYVTGKPSLLRCLLFYIVLGVLLLNLYFQREREKDRTGAGRDHGEETGKKKKNPIRFMTWALLLATLPMVLCAGHRKRLEIDVLDVGQGDGIYIQTEDGTSFFIDGGSTTVNEVGKYRILPFLKAKGAGSISYWFISHLDQDHMNGMVEVLQSGYPIKHLVLAEAMPKDEAYQVLCQTATEMGVNICYMKQGDFIRTGNTDISCLFPRADAGKRYEDPNDLSLTLLLECKGRKGNVFRALFSGDLAEKGETEVAALLEEQGIPRVDFYKVGHHGSKNSSSRELLSAMGASIAVISCGEKNHYGHPSQEAVERIRDVGAKMYFTMYGGEIMTEYHEGRIKVRSYVH